ncbi:unnamed protein product [Moneuplotes crassus]|uniref:PH domain-containing protein n=1 Tax=Euplotes crassus TaxID=5936 RepID=A0AAD1Y1A8_EUPCR|nr:unnamed protein product [Moneuplotes crassus]
MEQSAPSVASTYLYKLAGGVFNTSWHQRYFVFDAINKELSYYKNEREKKARGVLSLSGATVSEIATYKDKPNAFYIKAKSSKKMYLAGKSYEEAQLWRDRVILQLTDESNNTGFFNMESHPEATSDKHSEYTSSFVNSRKGSEMSRIFKRDSDSSNEESKLDKSGPQERLFEIDEECLGDGNDWDDPDTQRHEFPEEFKAISKKYQDFLLEQTSDWAVIKYSKNLKISALDYTPGKSVFKFSELKNLLVPCVLCTGIFFLFKTYAAHLPLFVLFIILGLICYSKKPNFRSLTSRKSKLLRGVTTMQCSSSNIANFITDVKIRKKYDSMHVNLAHASDDGLIEGAFLCIEHFRPPPPMSEYYDGNDQVKQIFLKFKCMHYSDESLTHFIIRKAEKWDECFIIIPFIENPDESLVYYYSGFGTKPSHLKDYEDDHEYIQYLQEKRFDFLHDLKLYCSKQSRVIHKARESNTLISRVPSKSLTEMLEESKKREMTFEERSKIIWKEFEHELTSESIIVGKNECVPMDQRFPNYNRMKQGHLWCNDSDILKNQKGILIDLVKRAGKKLMEGKGVVAVSLPVRLFERRSTVERMCDLWSTGPIFLLEAARSDNPVERLKKCITFFISGLHMSIEMRKPFNPIIGETFEACWPDNTKIYVEHISHHPPISSFLVEHHKGMYKYYGSYEYTAKLTDFGNSATGRQIGKNYIEFPDGTRIDYEFPYMKIGGLLFGKRTIKFSGKVQFSDPKNHLIGQLAFNSEGGIFKRKQGPVDQFTGTIERNGTVVSEIEGSWLENISFDGKIYWQLDKCHMIKPIIPSKCLPSDCRFREDSVAFGEGDLVWSQKEKERLEELQRADRKLRQDQAKLRRKKKSKSNS